MWSSEEYWFKLMYPRHSPAHHLGLSKNVAFSFKEYVCYLVTRKIKKL